MNPNLLMRRWVRAGTAYLIAISIANLERQWRAQDSPKWVKTGLKGPQMVVVRTRFLEIGRGSESRWEAES
jgi:hypothetical protein